VILATTGLTWLAVAIIAAALIVSLVDRTTLDALICLLLCGAAAMLLLAAWLRWKPRHRHGVGGPLATRW
jgi:hypothetical protein